MRHLALIAALLVAPAAHAGGGSTENCADLGTVISAQTMASSRSFTYDWPNTFGGYDTLALYITLLDADVSITRFDITCTVSDDGNVTDYAPQECTVASGVATCVDAGVWQKASPATAADTVYWSNRLDLVGFPDFQCAFSVGAGSGTAADVLTVKARLCTE